MARITTAESTVARMIEEAEGRAKVRRITYNEMLSILDKVETHVRRFSTRADMVGTKVFVDINAQRFSKAYKYTPDSTHFNAVFTPNGWKITKVSRGTCGTHLFDLELTEATKKHMADYVSSVLY